MDLGRWFDTGDPTVPELLDQGFSSAGLVVVVGHGVPSPVLRAARASARELFDLPESTKRLYSGGRCGSGWFGPGDPVVAKGYGTDDGASPLREVFALAGPRVGGEESVFPDEVPEMRDAWLRFLWALDDLAARMVPLLELAAEVTPGSWSALVERGSVSVGASVYPPVADPAADHGDRLPPHVDSGLLTFVDRRPSPAGLQVRAGHRFVDVPWVPGSLTVTVGQALATRSDGRWTAAEHRLPPPHPHHPEESLLATMGFLTSI